MKIFSWITVGLTLFLMLWGNVLSAIGAGLACPDWPLCYGTVFPPLRIDIVFEWGHRLIAALTTIFIFITLFKTWKKIKSNPTENKNLKIIMMIIAFLIIFQIILGGVTVLLELSIIASTVHLLTATILLSGLFVIACSYTWKKNEFIVEADSVFQKFAYLALLSLLIQIVLGGVVRHANAGLACPGFPTCLFSFFPLPITLETVVHFIHRWWAFVVFSLIIHLGAFVFKKAPRLKKSTLILVGVALIQVLAGIATVLLELHTHTRAFHAFLGYSLWLLLFYVTLRSGCLPFLWKPSRPRQ